MTCSRSDQEKSSKHLFHLIVGWKRAFNVGFPCKCVIETLLPLEMSQTCPGMCPQWGLHTAFPTGHHITGRSTLSFSTLGFPAGTSLQLLSWNATWLLFLLLRSKQQLNNPLRLHLCALYVHQAATEIHRSASLFQVLRLKLICGWSLRSSPKVSVSQWLRNMLKTGRLNIREGVNIVTPAP